MQNTATYPAPPGAELPCGFHMTPGGPSPDFPDYIGIESSADMCIDADEVVAEPDNNVMWLCRRKATRYERKEYPPLIPLLARTENLHSHMPWVLTRHYTSDGRLILTEEKVRHHEYFQVHRQNGRLTLKLVTLDDEVLLYHPDRQAKGVSEIPPLVEDQNEHFGNDVKADGQEEEEEEEEEEEGVRKAENGGGGVGCCGSSGSKCLNYTSAGVVVGSPSSSSKAGSCIIGMPLPVLRQVHG